ncbi:MAG: hypothetical protein ACP5H8_02290 [Candidatus Micrarchaeia archaeon]
MAIFLVVLTLFMFGCLGQEQTPQQSSKKADVSVSGLKVLNSTPVIVGQHIPIEFITSSSNESIKYTVQVREGSDKVYDEVHTDYGKIKITIPARKDGRYNISVSVSPEKGFYDPNATDNFMQVEFHVLPIFSSANISFENSTTISRQRSYATRVVLDSDVSIQSLGVVLRRSSILSQNTTLHYYLKKDVGGIPSNSSSFDVWVNLAQVSTRPVLILLQSDEKMIEKGTYWLETYIEGDGTVEIPCFPTDENISISSFSPISTKRSWHNQTCVPYYIISSQSPVYAYKEFFSNAN